mmetsp:Transcript_14789/g.10692  ORF Transcript_14789/g.10692 Transcript_14789/m.10692 type:complete len:333 (+) Transcript_14789:456-1454(+)
MVFFSHDKPLWRVHHLHGIFFIPLRIIVSGLVLEVHLIVERLLQKLLLTQPLHPLHPAQSGVEEVDEVVFGGEKESLRPAYFPDLSQWHQIRHTRQHKDDVGVALLVLDGAGVGFGLEVYGHFSTSANHGGQDLVVGLLVFGVAVNDQHVGLVLVVESCQRHVVVDLYWTIKWNLQYFSIAIFHMINYFVKVQYLLRMKVKSRHFYILHLLIEDAGLPKHVHIPHFVSWNLQFLSKLPVFGDPVLEVEALVRVLGVEFAEVLEFVHGFFVVVVVDEGNEVHVVLAGLIHYDLLLRHQLQRTLVEVEDLFEKVAVEVVYKFKFPKPYVVVLVR